MSSFWALIHLLLFVFYLLVITRVVAEVTRSFARSWRPAGVAAVGLEVVFTVTDPPIPAGSWRAVIHEGRLVTGGDRDSCFRLGFVITDPARGGEFLGDAFGYEICLEW